MTTPCPTCEALARTVMLDQTSHDTKRKWVGLTRKAIDEIWAQGGFQDDPMHAVQTFARAIEAKLKERNE